MCGGGGGGGGGACACVRTSSVCTMNMSALSSFWKREVFKFYENL